MLCQLSYAPRLAGLYPRGSGHPGGMTDAYEDQRDDDRDDDLLEEQEGTDDTEAEEESEEALGEDE